MPKTRTQNITDKEPTNVLHALERGLIQGQNPLQTALDVAGRINPATGQRAGGLISLTCHDLEVLVVVRRYLHQLDKRYLAFKLRDKRFDKAVKKGIADTKPIPAEKIERIITAYSNRLLRRRAEIITRTEALRSMNRAEYAINVQLVEDGRINRQAITKEWDDCGDKRVRRSHSGMAQKYGKGKGIPLDEPFIFASGARMLYPGDQSLGAPAREVIQCRCRAYYRVDFLFDVD